MSSSVNLVGRTRFLLMAIDRGDPWIAKVFTSREAAEREAASRNNARDEHRITKGARVYVPRGTAWSMAGGGVYRGPPQDHTGFRGRAPDVEQPKPDDGGPFYYVQADTEQDRRTRTRDAIDAIRRTENGS